VCFWPAGRRSSPSTSPRCYAAPVTSAPLSFLWSHGSATLTAPLTQSSTQSLTQSSGTSFTSCSAARR
ncbi:hypothetical protein GOODEAATRI_030034, partial [Goodea atripinnis]